MISLIGAIFTTLCVIGGYVLHHGKLAILWQPTELLIIGGAAIGSLLISSPIGLIKELVHMILSVLKGGHGSKENCSQLLVLMHDLIKTAQTNPLSLEPHIEKPENSDIFKKCEFVSHNVPMMNFICDTLRVVILGSLSPYDLDDLMEGDISSTHHQELKVPATLTRIGDAMPGLGIVAAVLGVVITMGKLAEGKEVIGESVAAALVGTFLGILLSYGYIQPLATRIEGMVEEEGIFYQVIKAALVAYSKGLNAKISLEFARRTIPPEFRPTFMEIEQELAKK
jgi:chemotaxis protein MotA